MKKLILLIPIFFIGASCFCQENPLSLSKSEYDAWSINGKDTFLIKFVDGVSWGKDIIKKDSIFKKPPDNNNPDSSFMPFLDMRNYYNEEGGKIDTVKVILLVGDTTEMQTYCDSAGRWGDTLAQRQVSANHGFCFRIRALEVLQEYYGEVL